MLTPTISVYKDENKPTQKVLENKPIIIFMQLIGIMKVSFMKKTLKNSQDIF